MVQAYEILLCVEHKYCYVLHKLRRVTSPFQCKGDHMQVLFESIHPNRKWDGSNPISVLQPNRRRIEPILATKQIKGWSRPQNVGWSHSNPLIPQPNRRLEHAKARISLSRTEVFRTNNKHGNTLVTKNTHPTPHQSTRGITPSYMLRLARAAGWIKPPKRTAAAANV